MHAGRFYISVQIFLSREQGLSEHATIAQACVCHQPCHTSTEFRILGLFIFRSLLASLQLPAVVRTQVQCTLFRICPDHLLHSLLPPLCIAASTPKSGKELKGAIAECLKVSQQGDCSKGPHGTIGSWDVSRLRDMTNVFRNAALFNSDISKWDVSRVTAMNNTFRGAQSFNCDISKWDVSSVTDMDEMFHDATAFRQILCGTAWVYSTASKTDMFANSFGSISETACMSTKTKQSARKPAYIWPRQVVWTLWPRRPLPDRELIVRTSIATTAAASTATNAMTCPKCGKFEKSGRVSCCAPGGAWYKNCGNSRNRNVDHRWFEGVAACKRKSKARRHVDTISLSLSSDYDTLLLFCQ